MVWDKFREDIEKEKEKEKEKERNHQDNFFSESSYNNNFQYCDFCGKNQRFEWDRCSVCKNS